MFRSAFALTGVLAAGALAGAATAPAASAPRLHVTWPPSVVVRVTTPLTVSGGVTGAPRAAHVQLQQRPGTTWMPLSGGRVSSGRFRVSWTPPRALSERPLTLRLALIAGGRTLASTRPWMTLIGQPVRKCTLPPPTGASLPAGDGEIIGGAYILGGPAPGIDSCLGDAYTVTATPAGGTAAATTQQVAGGHGYDLVLPAGSYTLSGSGCGTVGARGGSVQVTAGAVTHADVDCDVP